MIRANMQSSSAPAGAPVTSYDFWRRTDYSYNVIVFDVSAFSSVTLGTVDNTSVDTFTLTGDVSGAHSSLATGTVIDISADSTLTLTAIDNVSSSNDRVQVSGFTFA